MITVGDIYSYIDSFAPFSQQQSYDNSGVCVGSMGLAVTKVLTALDITTDVVREAEREGCELVISHHPVIFRGLKHLELGDPAVMLAAMSKAAICAHTSYDSAEGGMNDILAEKLGLEIIETLSFDEGKPIGYVCGLPFECSASHLASLCKKKLGCEVVRYTPTDKSIRRAAVCSGSGGSFLAAAQAKGCDALITGDVKHSDLIAARNDGFCLIDAGHFYTENIFHRALAEKLAEEFPELVIMQAKNSIDPAEYIK